METPVETEVKIRLKESPAQVRRQLRNLGAQLRKARTAEENLLFDFEDDRLQNSGCALRLRQYGEIRTLTFKGPRIEDPRFKKRPEHQIQVSSLEAARAILGELGLLPSFRYDKHREKFQLAVDGGRVDICLDETPVGNFVEIEGPEPLIEEAARRLGWTAEEFVTANYVDLYQKQGSG